jgi:mannose-6-phosphate isomerase
MLVLKPMIHDTIWGGPRLSRFTEAKGDSVGHLYSAFCREGISNEILNGEYKDRLLNEVFPLWKKDVGMEEYEYFPLTLSLTEADQNLSIQVHPSDKVAREIEHRGRGKRESWYFLEAPEDGLLINGCRVKDKDEVRKLLDQERYRDILDAIHVEVGDYVFVEPGTLHAISAGSLVYEIEEGSDSTYRFYDFDRTDANGNKRELHVEMAYLTLDPKKQSVVKHYEKGKEIVEATYATEKLDNITSYRNDSDDLKCFTLVYGTATCDGIRIGQGTTVLLFPGEEIDDMDVRLAFTARLRRDIDLPDTD